MSSKHLPVLLREVLQQLVPAISPDSLVLDCTLGGGGHLRALMQAGAAGARFIGLDQDSEAIKRAAVDLSEDVSRGVLTLVHGSFANFFEQNPGTQYDAILADLGYSSDQLEDAQRGLSFQTDGPLDMRLDRSQGETAFELLSVISQEELSQLIRELGEERFSGRIARVICEARDRKELQDSTLGLADLIFRSVPRNYRYGRIHPATRSFQALRIAVNEELRALDSLLKHAILCLKPGGRLAVISFHSLEDRRVKLRFRELKKQGFKVLTPRPLVADDNEVKNNPRARSAKLRVIERVID